MTFRPQLQRLIRALVTLGAVIPAACGVGVGEIEFRGAAGSLTPHLAMAGDRPVLSWLEPTPRGHALRVAVRQDTGWAVLGPVVEHDSLFVNWADFPSVVPLSNGSWLAHWLQKTAPSAYAYHVRMAVSRDSGRTWGPPFSPHGDSSATEHGFAAIASWGDGAASVWLDGRNMSASHPPAHPPTRPPAGGGPGGGVEGSGGAMTLRFTTITGDGAPAPDLEVDARVCDCCQTDLARTRHGLVAVYRDRGDDEIRDVAVVRLVNDRWTSPRPVAADGWRIAGCPVNGPQVAARGDSVVVAWFTAAGEILQVKAAFSADGGDRFGPPVTVNEGRPAGRVDVVWWGSGALVSWLEETPTAGMVRVRRVRPVGAMDPAITVATTSTARASGFPRMVAAGDLALIAWTEPGDSGGVRVALLRGGR
jgi:hypothetical protein